jgi:hypothetical protein
MKNLWLAALAGWVLISCPVFSLAQSVAKGVVYEDINSNNIREKKEKGIPGVAVSNGVSVVVTNEKGEYELPVADDNILFVIKPAHYGLPLNEYNQPQFYYIHKPKGSPALENPGIPPTGPLPASVNFPLVPAEPVDSFSMLVFGDSQPYTPQEAEYFNRGIAEELAGVQGFDMGITLGDLAGDNPSLYLPYKTAIRRIGIPWHHVMGNHDMNYDVVADSLSDECFERHFGPATYSFNHGMAHFIVLDDILYPDPRDGNGYWGGFTRDQLLFIENDLAVVPKDRIIVLAFHIPLSEREGGSPYRDADRRKLFELLKDYPHTLSLSAHTHFQSQDFLDSTVGWLQPKKHHHFNVAATCGDWYSGKLDEKGIPLSTMRDGTPRGYALLHFKGIQYTIDYKVAGMPADYRVGIFAPRVVAQNRETTAGIYANFFAGGEDDKLYYRIDNGSWKPMDQAMEFDPTYLHLLHEWDFAEELPPGRRPSNPEICSHLWRGNIPTGLETGLHTIEVKVVDMFGRTFFQKGSYRLAVAPL